MQIPIFPLNTVLFPGGLLPLKVFEQRYIEMTKLCLKEARPFGVCLIREGQEVGAAATPEDVGCLATIKEWDMQQLGIFQLKTAGVRRFRIDNREAAANGLISAEVTMLLDEPEIAATAESEACANVLRVIVDQVGADKFQTPLRYEDPSWIGYRLAELLPIKLATRQRLLEINDAQLRLHTLLAFLKKHGLGGR
ncbi:MAG: LON peptidase substrate-binding domain-containing protein [Burkholderiales bacterium]|nr:LON peptidase substrate-binding domain-containing protein [Burkholderiales bacterium]